VRKIGVYFEKCVIAAGQAPVKGGKICLSQAPLFGAVYNMQPFRICRNKSFDNFRRTIGGIIVNNKNFCGGRNMGKNRLYKRLYIFRFVICWNGG
jgi:hypothetical protein